LLPKDEDDWGCANPARHPIGNNSITYEVLVSENNPQFSRLIMYVGKSPERFGDASLEASHRSYLRPFTVRNEPPPLQRMR